MKTEAYEFRCPGLTGTKYYLVDITPKAFREVFDMFWYEPLDKLYPYLHREDGPSIVCEDGERIWILHGNSYSFNEYVNKLGLSEEEKVAFKLKYY